MLAWLLITEWVPLPPLNDLEASPPSHRLRAALVNYSVLAVIAAGVATGTVIGAIVAVVLAGAWLLGHVASWWLPYLGLSTAGQRDAYRREYARTLKILPTAGHDVVVDVQHMVVGAITVPMVVAVALHLAMLGRANVA
jgi:hypothetical protein